MDVAWHANHLHCQSTSLECLPHCALLGPEQPPPLPSSQKLLTIHSVFLASLFSSPKVSNSCSISLCRVALRSSAAARAFSDSTILAWTAWYQWRCCTRLVFSRTTSTCSSSLRCSRLVEQREARHEVVLHRGTKSSQVFHLLARHIKLKGLWFFFSLSSCQPLPLMSSHWEPLYLYR